MTCWLVSPGHLSRLHHLSKWSFWAEVRSLACEEQTETGSKAEDGEGEAKWLERQWTFLSTQKIYRQEPPWIHDALRITPSPSSPWASPCPCPPAFPSAPTPHSQPLQRFLFALILKSPKFSPVSDTSDNFEPITTAKRITLYSDTVSPLHRNFQVVNFPRSECVFVCSSM